MKFKPGDIVTFEGDVDSLVSDLIELYDRNGGCFIIESSRIHEYGYEHYCFVGDEEIRKDHCSPDHGWILTNVDHWKRNKFRPIKPFKFPNR